MKQIPLILFSLLLTSLLIAKELPPRAQKARELTTSLIGLNKSYQKAQGKNKEELKKKLIAKAQERRDYLLELMQSNPTEVLKVTIPKEKHSGMPAEVLDKLEQKMELEGELESTYLDNFEHPALSRLKHELKSASGERFELHFADKRPELPFGSKVKAYGLLLGSNKKDGIDGAVVVGGEDSKEYPIAYAGADGTVNDSPNSIANNTFGEVKTLVMLANFQDNQSQPYTQAFARDIVFNQVNNYFKENSFGKSWLSGDVTPWLTLPINSTDSTYCYGRYLKETAYETLQSSGYDLNTYDRIMIVTLGMACGFTGAAEVGGKYSRINGALDNFYTVAHELGHNYGLHHAKSLVCNDGSIIGQGSPQFTTWYERWPNCEEKEYGSTVDIMGASRSAHIHANNKEVLGWLEYGNMPDITEVTQSGRYEIDVLASQSPSIRPKALKVLKAINPLTGTKSWYYIEFRQPVGFDSILGKTVWSGSKVDPNNITNGVVIHAVYGPGTNNQWLLDMTPATLDMVEPRDPALVVGETFHGPDGDLSITPESVDSTKAVVNISYDGDPTTLCTHTHPSLSLTPSQGPWVAAGTPVNYSITVTNKDNSTCPSSDYALSSIIPGNWSATFKDSNLTLAPGESASTTLSVTSVNTASDGFYDITVTAASVSYSSSSTVTYVVDNPETSTNSAPIALGDAAQTTEDTSVTINVLANDSDPDGDALTVSNYIQAVHGTLLFVDSVFTYTPDSGFSGSDSFTYTISDGQGGSSSATVSIIVTAAPEPPVEIDEIKPTISITSPLSGELVSPDQILKITAEAQDNIEMNRVEFFVNDTLVCTDQIASYQCEYAIPKRGKDKTFVIKAVAFDSSNNDAIATITVNKTESSKGGKGRNK